MSTILMVDHGHIIPLKFEKNGVLSVDDLPRSVHTPSVQQSSFVLSLAVGVCIDGPREIIDHLEYLIFLEF